MHAEHRFVDQGVPSVKLLRDESTESDIAEALLSQLGITAEVSRNRGESMYRPSLVFRYGQEVEHFVGLGNIRTALATRFSFKR